MCIYCGTTQYRKIYEKHFGPIPKDENGKSYDIHHIDFNKLNNDPVNLVALSIQEHYDLHYGLEHYAACQLIAIQRLNKNAEELSDIARKNALKRLESGNHPFLDGEAASKRNLARVANGTNPFLGNKVQRKRVAEGTHPFQKREDGTSLQTDRVANGTHHLSGGELQRKQVMDGKHHLLGGKIQRKQLENGTHPSQIKKICEHCNKISSLANHARWHGEKCKYKYE